MTRILVADDHALIREGVRGQLAVLDGELAFVEARDWTQAFAAAADPSLDLAIIDLKMPGRDGLEALGELMRAQPGLPVLVLSASEDLDDIRRALQAGAMGYLPKAESAAVLVAAVKLVLGGSIYVPPALAGLGTSQAGAGPAVPRPPQLTERQLDVLRLLVDGCSNQEIADRLKLALPTVKVHLAAIFRALDVVNRTQAAMAAHRLGLFS